MKIARANVRPIRQRTQFSCMGASLSMCLGANGVEADEDTVNRVMGCKPMQGASWEQALAAAQHFGMRATLVTPCAMSTLKDWTDRGIPVMIAWNPEGRDWSHASVVFDVDGDGNIHIADPNIPDPDETVRVVSREDFLKKWFEKWPDYLVRRPALAIEREITPDGRQIQAAEVPRGTRRAAEGKIRRFTSTDWATFAGADTFEDGSDPLIVDLSIRDGFEYGNQVYTDVSILAHPLGMEFYFTNPRGQEILGLTSTKLDSSTAETALANVVRAVRSGNMPRSMRFLK